VQPRLTKHLSIIACVVSLVVLYLLVTQDDPTGQRGNKHGPPLLWGYDSSETSCNDAVDNDNDFLIDCEDSDCDSDDACMGSEDCTNNVDDNDNGLIDCEDSACSSDPSCT
jgi:hypothetical protein